MINWNRVLYLSTHPWMTIGHHLLHNPKRVINCQRNMPPQKQPNSVVPAVGPRFLHISHFICLLRRQYRPPRNPKYQEVFEASHPPPIKDSLRPLHRYLIRRMPCPERGKGISSSFPASSHDHLNPATRPNVHDLAISQPSESAVKSKHVSKQSGRG